ncbi:MAG: hypothetical protein V7L05_06325 [Nostoc sp.]|uniref:hypothetical protein n=1 Tax=Nostoc sp. TaxID=1180 RepID=UPI002FF53C78
MTLPIKEIILAPGEGNHLTMGNTQAIFKAVGADTHGHLGLFEYLIQPGGTTPDHAEYSRFVVAVLAIAIIPLLIASFLLATDYISKHRYLPFSISVVV